MNNLSQHTASLDDAYYSTPIPECENQPDTLLKKAERTSHNKVNVNIMGQDYILQGNANSDYILSLVNYVDSKMKELKKLSSNLDSKKMAILVAINICDELFQLKKQIDKVPDIEDLEKISSKTNNIIFSTRTLYYRAF